MGKKGLAGICARLRSSADYPSGIGYRRGSANGRTYRLDIHNANNVNFFECSGD